MTPDTEAWNRYTLALKELIRAARKIDLTMGRILVDISEEYVAERRLPENPLKEVIE